MKTIYKITNLINKKIYIGQTIRGLENRWRQHRQDYKRFNSPLYKAMKKYGIENFSIEIICYCSDLDHLNEMETHHILKNKSNHRERGYNCDTGGNSKKFNDETKRKISKSNKNKIPWNKNKKMSKEFCQKMSDIHKLLPNNQLGRKRTKESRKKMAESHRGKPSNRKGKKLTAHTKKLISQNHPDFSGNKHPRYNHTKYNFINDSGIEETCTSYELQTNII